MDGVIHQSNLWASYIWPSYILTVGGMVALLVWGWVSMRNAEKRAEGMKKREG